ARERRADAVDQHRDVGMLAQAQRLLVAAALDGGDVTVDDDALGARLRGALLELRGRREDELAGRLDRLVEERERLLLLECRAARLVVRERLEELLPAEGVRGVRHREQ